MAPLRPQIGAVMSLGPEHIVLITNLQWVVINEIRLNAHAILVEPQNIEPGDGRVRGFVSSGTCPVFDVRTKVFEHIIDVGGREEVVRFGGGLVVQLVRCDRDRPIDVERFEPDANNEVYLNIWEQLSSKVAFYWPSQQYMPRTVFGPR